MKRVLIVKTSSMGDVLHTLPALTDARAAYPEICFDWAVEEGLRKFKLAQLLIPLFLSQYVVGVKTGLVRLFALNVYNFVTRYKHIIMMR